MYQNELYHHGIKGQKWGVRRYQNSEGSLTKEGKIRYSEDDEKISKGTRIYRVANSKEHIDSKRKYVSITSNDRQKYLDDANESILWNKLGISANALPMDYNKPISEFTYEATKDLRVVSGKKVVNDLLEQYGDKQYKTLVKDYIDGKYDNLNNDSKFDLDIGVAGIYETFMRKHGNEIIENYKHKGYDAMVDPADWVGNIAEYPIILLDPSNSIKKKKETRLS